MKLYATIETEKLINGEIKTVTKHQGSNTCIEINIQGEDGEFLGLFRMKKTRDSVGDLWYATIDFAEYVYVNGKHWLDAEVQDKDYTKGKSQKGENYTLGECIICDTPLSKDKTCPLGC